MIRIFCRTITYALLASSTLWMAAGCQPPKTKAQIQLEQILEAGGSLSPALPPGELLPGQSPGTPASAEEIPDEVIEALAEVLLESEDESAHPLAFYFLPQTEYGGVDWVSAIELGVIRPIDDLNPEKKTMPPMDFNVIFKVKGDMPDVVYPHYPHTLWMDCKNCHPDIFVMQAGVNDVSMDAITRGEYCGRCHGKVAFPLTECDRCHSRPKPGRLPITPMGRG